MKLSCISRKFSAPAFPNTEPTKEAVSFVISIESVGPVIKPPSVNMLAGICTICPTFSSRDISLNNFSKSFISIKTSPIPYLFHCTYNTEALSMLSYALLGNDFGIINIILY